MRLHCSSRTCVSVWICLALAGANCLGAPPLLGSHTSGVLYDVDPLTGQASRRITDAVAAKTSRLVCQPSCSISRCE